MSDMTGGTAALSDTEREQMHRLFTPDPPDEQEPRLGNHVPREGATTDPRPTDDAAAREFVRNLFPTHP